VNLPRLLRTVRYLRPVQIYGRLLFRLRSRRVRGPVRAAVAAPMATAWQAPMATAWQAPIATQRSQLGGDRFRLLGEEHRIESPADWRRSDLEPLWLYNLHYFDDLRASDASARRAEQRALLERWVRENPPGEGIGWDPHPCSLRIVNWIKWALAGGELGSALEQSLALQAEHLSRQLEHHLQGNHLLANAKGLAFAGLFFSGTAPQRWLACAAALLERQLPEQILPDGGHCERSPMYHALVLEDLLDLINLSRISAAGAALDAPRQLEPRAKQMLEWLRRLTHPDGEISFFNDAALGVAAPPQELCEYAARLGLRTASEPLCEVEHLRDSGYVRLARGPAVLIADVAEIGPAHLTGHSHADTLSFELSLAGKRVLVNSGTSRYGTGPERLRQRSTAAHNTVEIDGENSSEVWSGFRVGRRARPFGLEIERSAGEISLRCSHDGYRHRPGRPVHERRWRLRDGGLAVIDRLHGRFGEARASYHAAPGVCLELEPGRIGGVLRTPGGSAVSLALEGGVAQLEPTTYHPRFGSSLATHVLRVAFSSPECELTLEWS
jgi:uncharacterized heparinase superfamily protein